MIALAAVLSLLIGVVLGMLGGGGAILTLPMLVYLLHLEPKSAIATSLLVVAAVSLVGMVLHARARTVRWKVGMAFAAASMTGAFLGGRLAHFVPDKVLLVAFGVVMIATALGMLRGRQAAAPTAFRLLPIFGLGALVGLLSGLVGAGGGFLVVPALTLFGGLAMRDAIGTSLFVITLQSFAGFLGHSGHAAMDGSLVALIMSAAVVGTIVGVSIGTRVPAAGLRQAFGWLVVSMGIFLFAKELPPMFAVALALTTLGAIVLVSRTKYPPSSPMGTRTDR